MTITGTNLSLELRRVVAVANDGPDVATVTIPRRTLGAFLVGADKDDTIEVDVLPPDTLPKRTSGVSRADSGGRSKWDMVEITDGSGVRLRRGGLVVTVGRHPDTWPETKHDIVHEAAIPEGLAAAVRACLPAVGTDYARPILEQICLRDGEAVGSDSYRMIVVPCPPIPRPDDQPKLVPDDILVPRHVARHIPESGTVRLGPKAGWLEFEDDDGNYAGAEAVGGRSYPADYPPYKQLIPTAYTARLTFDRKEVLRALAPLRAATVTRHGDTVVMNIGDGEVTVATTRDDEGEGRFEVAVPVIESGMLVSTAPVSIGFTPSFLVAGFRAVPHPVVNLDITDRHKPVMIHAEGHRYVLMPVRLSAD